MGIKKLLVLSILIYSFALFSKPCFAGNIAYVHVMIEDAPPRINNIFIMPEIAYPDSVLSCEANISLLKVEYNWIANSIIVGKDKYIENKFNAGDRISCEIIATDYLNHVAIANATANIQPKNILQATGYAISNINAKPQLKYGTLIMLIAIITSIFGLRKYINKFKPHII